MRQFQMAALALTVVAGLSAGPALADPGRGHGGPGGPGGPEGGMMMGRMMDQLKLTPDQRGKMETIRARNMEASKPMHEDLMKKRRELFELVRSPKATREAAVAKQREIDTLQNRLAEARLAAWFDSRALLTPEQLTLLGTMPMKGHRGWRAGKDK